MLTTCLTAVAGLEAVADDYNLNSSFNTFLSASTAKDELDQAQTSEAYLLPKRPARRRQILMRGRLIREGSMAQSHRARVDFACGCCAPFQNAAADATLQVKKRVGP
jgi:hypothetical protein